MSGEDSWGFDSGIADGEASSEELRPPRPGESFGADFDLLEELGSGGFGVVFRARERSSDRELALKVLTRRLTSRQRQRFEREGELTAALRHPGIVRIHSAGEVGGVPYLAYELLSGESLKERLGELGREARVRIVIDAARAVGYAHTQGVIHRDLKPDNLLLDDEGKVRVADFGLARGEHVDRLTQSGAMVGTPSHMAPEQWDTASGVVSPATDVWALGAILYRCLTDAPPFEAPTLVAMGAAVCSGDLVPPRKLDPSIPAALEAVCVQALGRRPEDRYPDAGAFADDLEAALEGRMTWASSAAWTLAGARLRERGRSALPLLAAACALAAALVFVLSPRGVTAVEVQQRVAELVAGRGSVPALEEALASGVDLPESLRRDAHLALAHRREGEAALAHAEAATRLTPNQHEPHAARGRALAALRRWDEAAEAFRRAGELGGGPATWLTLARIELERQSRPRAAEAACGRALRGAEGAERDDALALRARARLAASELRGAEADLRALSSGFDPLRRHFLRAELIRAQGGDLEAFLRQGTRAWPKQPLVWEALVEALVTAGELRAARAAAGDWAARGGGTSAARAVCAGLDAVLAAPPRLDGLRTAWRRPVIRWFLREAERELALRDRAADVLTERHPKALPAATRTKRARARLEAARGLAVADPQLGARAHRGLAQLEPPGARARAAHLAEATAQLAHDPLTLRLRAEDALAGGRYAEALELTRGRSERLAQAVRGRALLALGRARDAIPALEAASDERRRLVDCQILLQALREAGEAPRVAEMEERIRRLKGSQRAEARRWFHRARDLRRSRESTRAKLFAAHRRALEYAPLFVEPAFMLAKLRYIANKEPADLARILEVLERAPRLFDDFQRNMLTSSQGFAGRTGIQRLLDVKIDRSDDLQRGALLALSVFALEYEGRADLLAPTLREADDLLRRHPANLSVRTLRGFLLTRAGKLARAERDLSIVTEAAPDHATAAFYRGLLAAKQQRPVAEVRRHLKRARALDYDTWDDLNWRADVYPEMTALRKARTQDLDRFSE